MITAEVPVRRRAPAGLTPVLGRKAFVEQVMGMPVSIHVRASEPTRPDIAAAVERAFAHLRRVDEVFSIWRADSDLLRLQHGEVEAADEGTHPWLGEVVELCLEAEDRTDGLFSAWRSRPGGRTTFDPTGIVKGWAVVGAAAHLEVVEEITWCLGAGGDIAVGAGRGLHGVDPVWQIGIEDPGDRRQVADVVTLSRGGIATSGAAARGAHVTDPRTGEGIERAGSATVVGPDLMWADVWATAAWVAPDQARRLLADRDPDYRLITL